MKDFLEFLVKNIVTKESEIKIEEIVNPDNSLILQLTVAKEDMGLIIGKEGKTIRALRNLIKAKAIKEDKRVNVEITEIPQNII